MRFTALGDSPQISFALRIFGQAEGIVVISLHPAREISGGIFKGTFHNLAELAG